MTDLRRIAEDLVGGFLLDNDIRLIRKRGKPLVDLVTTALERVRKETLEKAAKVAENTTTEQTSYIDSKSNQLIVVHGGYYGKQIANTIRRLTHLES